MDSIILARSLQELRPNCEFAIYNNDLSQIMWHDKTVVSPSEEEILEKYNELLSKEKLEEYKLLRKKEYPDIGDQLDALFHAGVFPQDMADKIQAVKNKYPKP